MPRGPFGHLALLVSFVVIFSSCTKEGDTITYETPAATPPASGSIIAVTSTNILVNVTPSAPATVLSAIPIQGLAAGETFEGIDYRPANKRLNGWTNSGRLYQIDTVTGVALQVGLIPLVMAGNFFGFDFNPVVDRARIVTDQNSNVRVDPTDASSVVDLDLAFAAGDVHVGSDPEVVGLAYSNSVAGATTTTAYGIDLTNAVLVTVNPPNNGTLNTVGDLGLPAYQQNLGFDISPGGVGYLVMGLNSSVNLYTVNIATGAATLVGPLGTGAAINGTAVVP